MEAIKELVERALEKKRVLSQMKAELRAQVFLAIDEEETSSGNEGLVAKTRNPQREALLANEEGKLLVALVREFLEWAGLEFTAKVFEPEMGPQAEYHGRMGLSKQLGMSADVASQAPLLLKVLRQYQSPDPGGAAKGTLGTRPAAPIATAVARPPQAALADPAPAAHGPEHSYDENFEVESDEGLAGAEIIADEEEEEYSAVMVKANPATQAVSQGGPQVPTAVGTHHLQPPSGGGTGEQQGTDGQEGEGMDLSASSLSTSGFMAGRLRRARQRGQDAPGGGDQFDQSDDLLVSDRSGAISHELAGYAPLPVRERGLRDADVGGGLSLSGELPAHPDEEEEEEDKEYSHSLSRSDADNSGDLSRSNRSLEPLPAAQRAPASLGKLTPLGPQPLAPLGAAAAPKLGPLHAPRVLSPPNRDGDQLKQELYRAGLLPPKKATEPNTDSDAAGRSGDSDDAASEQGSSNHSGSGGGGGGSEVVSSQHSSAHDGSQAGGRRGSPGGSSGHSSNQDQSSKHRRLGQYDESKAVSMDLKDTGLSASDQSGDLETGTLPLMGLDMAETAEWGS